MSSPPRQRRASAPLPDGRDTPACEEIPTVVEDGPPEPPLFEVPESTPAPVLEWSEPERDRRLHDALAPTLADTSARSAASVDEMPTKRDEDRTAQYRLRSAHRAARGSTEIQRSQVTRERIEAFRPAVERCPEEDRVATHDMLSSARMAAMHGPMAGRNRVAAAPFQRTRAGLPQPIAPARAASEPAPLRPNALHYALIFVAGMTFCGLVTIPILSRAPTSRPAQVAPGPAPEHTVRAPTATPLVPTPLPATTATEAAPAAEADERPITPAAPTD